MKVDSFEGGALTRRHVARDKADLTKIIKTVFLRFSRKREWCALDGSLSFNLKPISHVTLSLNQFININTDNNVALTSTCCLLYLY